MNNNTGSKFYSTRNLEQKNQGVFAIIRCRNFIFLSTMQKYKSEDTQNYNFACSYCIVVKRGLSH